MEKQTEPNISKRTIERVTFDEQIDSRPEITKKYWKNSGSLSIKLTLVVRYMP